MYSAGKRVVGRCKLMGKIVRRGLCDVPWFKCSIRGENFPGQLIGIEGLLGFYTTRFVEANDPEAAKTDVLRRLLTDPKLAPPSGYTPTEKAKLHFDQIEEIAAELVPPVQPGFAWHPMKVADALEDSE